MSQVEQGRIRRRRFLIDPKWQLPVSIGMAATALGSGLLFALLNLLLTARDPLEDLSGRDTALLAMAANGAYFLVLAGLLFYVILRITHRVAGPAMVIERAIDGLVEGRFDARLTLRRGDYLKSLAAATQRLSDHLKAEQGDRDRTCVELERAVARGDRKAAIELLQRLRATQVGPGQERPHVLRIVA